MVQVRHRMLVDLSAAELQRWREMFAVARFPSPFLHPEYFLALQAAGHRVEVAALYEGRDLCGILPFERTLWRIAQPVGGSFCDYQAPLCDTTLDLDWQELSHVCGVRGWNFMGLVNDHLPGPSPDSDSGAYYLQLDRGFSAYCHDRKVAGSETIEKMLRKRRRWQREAKLWFELRHEGAKLLERLIERKQQFYRKLGVALSLTQLGLQRFHAYLDRRPDCGLRAEVSVLWANGEPAGLSYLLRTTKMAHCWQISHEPAFASFSPGINHLLFLAEALADEGVEQLHLGQGDERFKRSLASGQVSIWKGVRGVAPWLLPVLNIWQRTREAIKRSPLSPLVRVLQPLRQWACF